MPKRVFALGEKSKLISEIMRLRDLGESYTTISKKLGIHFNTVERWYKEEKFNNNIDLNILESELQKKNAKLLNILEEVPLPSLNAGKSDFYRRFYDWYYQLVVPLSEE